MLKIILSLILLIAACLQAKAQNLVGIYNNTISISPSYTVTNNTTITVVGQVINLGTTPFTGDIHVNIAIDTSSSGVAKYYLRSTMSYPVVNFPPNGIISFNVGDVASGNNSYKIAGNGTTVVAWPIAGALTDSLTSADSAFTNIYIMPLLQGLTNFEKELIKIPNPIAGSLNLTYLNATEIIVYDMLGNKLTKVINNNTLFTNELPEGLYLLKIRMSNDNIYTKKVYLLKD